MRLGISVVDVLAGLHTTIGVLAALRVREETGEGQLVEVNLLSSALSGMVNHASAAVAGGVVPLRMGNDHPSLAPYEPLPAADGELVIAVGNDRQFSSLCAVLGAPELATDVRLPPCNPRPDGSLSRSPGWECSRSGLADPVGGRAGSGCSTEVGVPCGLIGTGPGRHRRWPNDRPAAEGCRRVRVRRRSRRCATIPIRLLAQCRELPAATAGISTSTVTRSGAGSALHRGTPRQKATRRRICSQPSWASGSTRRRLSSPAPRRPVSSTTPALPSADGVGVAGPEVVGLHRCDREVVVALQHDRVVRLGDDLALPDRAHLCSPSTAGLSCGRCQASSSPWALGRKRRRRSRC